MRPVRRFGLALALLASVIGLTTPAPAAEASTQTFSQTLGSDPEGHFLLTVKIKHGRPVGGSFEAANIYLSCGDGIFDDRASFGPARVRFVNRERFSVDLYSSGEQSGFETYFRAIGRVILDKGRAQGQMFGFINQLQAPPGEQPQPECSTLGWGSWQAFR